MPTPIEERETLASESWASHEDDRNEEVASLRPFDLLAIMQTRAILHAIEPPEQQEQIVLWSGVGFSLNRQRYVVPIGEVSEILPVPGTTSLPGTKAWVKGVSNVRGRLIPIVDLATFLNFPNTSENTQKRIMVVERKDMLVGLIVDEVQGMLQFPSDTYSDDLPDAFVEKSQEAINRCTSGSYKKDIDYIVFSTEKLINSPEFLMAASE